MLDAYIRQRLADRDILLMTHIVLGYPSMAASLEIAAAMVEAGVDLMELQIPFSEPMADGPVILKANQRALADGVTVSQCMDAAATLARTHPIPFLFMTYYNILFKYGVERFAQAMADRQLRGAIIPDLPPEEGRGYLDAMAARGLAPIFIFAPTTPASRMTFLAEHARGFIYCVARKGVTGRETDFSSDLDDYLGRCRRATDLPLAVGFGVKNRNDVDFLRGKADIAVVGTETIRVVDAQGVSAVGPFVRGLRS